MENKNPCPKCNSPNTYFMVRLLIRAEGKFYNYLSKKYIRKKGIKILAVEWFGNLKKEDEVGVRFTCRNCHYRWWY